MRKTILFSFLLFVAAVGVVTADVVIYPAPDGERLSTDYTVLANGKQVDVYTARVQDPPWDKTKLDHGGTYSFASFDMQGSVEIKIRSLNRSVRGTIVRPLSFGIKPVMVSDSEMSITLDAPCKFSVELDGKNKPLLIFANPMEDDIPDKNDENVIYYGPGIYKPRLIALKDNQILYIAGGAVVKGAVVVAGDNTKICGRGIIDGSDWEWSKGPAWNLIPIFGDNVVLEDIIVRGSPTWTIVPQHCKNILIKNVKICNGRAQNDDGINPVNAQDVMIDDCFIRTDDDCIALKGMEYRDKKDNNVERITVKNSILWCDRARVTLLGHESRAHYMRDILYRNIDIVHFYMVPFLLEPGEDMRLQNVSFENIRLHGEGQDELVRLRPVVNKYMYKQVPGFISDIHFKDIRVTGQGGTYAFQLFGKDARHIIENVTFENILINGQRVKENSVNIQSDEYVKKFRFSE